MPSWPEANSPTRSRSLGSFAAAADRFVGSLLRRPGTWFLAALVVTIVLYHVGILEPLDWWGTGSTGR